MSGILIGLIMFVLVLAVIGLMVGITAVKEQHARYVMSRSGSDRPFKSIVDPLIAQQTTQAGQPIATPDNAINSALSGNDEAIFQDRIARLAKLIKTGQVTNMAKGIETMFDCSRSSKPESTYQRARKALEPLIQDAPKFPPLTPEQEQFRREMGLPVRH